MTVSDRRSVRRRASISCGRFRKPEELERITQRSVLWLGLKFVQKESMRDAPSVVPVVLMGAMLTVVAIVASACATLPPVMGGTPAAGRLANRRPARPARDRHPAPRRSRAEQRAINEVARQTLAEQLGINVENSHRGEREPGRLAEWLPRHPKTRDDVHRCHRARLPGDSGGQRQAVRSAHGPDRSALWPWRPKVRQARRANTRLRRSLPGGELPPTSASSWAWCRSSRSRRPSGPTPAWACPTRPSSARR